MPHNSTFPISRFFPNHLPLKSQQKYRFFPLVRRHTITELAPTQAFNPNTRVA
jgi:hypothetical protein